ncbi:MAG: ligase-associated DNA damage response DEXH box helicase, partial [Pseudomonadota bacterium]
MAQAPQKQKRSAPKAAPEDAAAPRDMADTSASREKRAAKKTAVKKTAAKKATAQQSGARKPAAQRAAAAPKPAHKKRKTAEKEATEKRSSREAAETAATTDAAAAADQARRWQPKSASEAAIKRRMTGVRADRTPAAAAQAEAASSGEAAVAVARKRGAKTRTKRRPLTDESRDTAVRLRISEPVPDVTLPPVFANWFASRGWAPRAHQQALLGLAANKRSSLLIAPTGAGKTLAGFLPSLVDLHTERATQARTPRAPGAAAASGPRLHTLYVSPLKALAVDIARNLSDPVAEMGLDITVETRSGDTSVAKRQRQRSAPPDILLTTPEQIALLLSHEDAPRLFGDLKYLILDELHSLVASKRGDLLALDIARLRALCPNLIVTGLSATVARPSELRAFIVPQHAPETRIDLGALAELKGGVKPDLTILEGDDPLPWSGHTARYAMQRVYRTLHEHTLTIVFVNTRSQAEQVFQELWRLNDDNLPIALHHGSLEAGQRRKVEAAMADGRLRAVVATSTLDLGIDWGDIDLVVHIGAPKGASRLIQRIGRANHRLDEPSTAILVPSNRFEVLECRAALDAARAGAQDAVLNRTGALDVLAQHVMGCACAAPFHPDDLFAEVRTAAAYAELTRDQFDRVIDFVATGGYALRAYDRFARLRPEKDGRLRIAHPRLAQQHRMNIGTIVQSPMLKVRMVRARPQRQAAALKVSGQPGDQRALAGGRVMGEIDEWFAGELTVGDTFVFAGEVVRFEGLRETDLFVSRATSTEPAIPSYPGGKFPLSTHLAERVRTMLSDPTSWDKLPTPVAEWLTLQQERAVLPTRDEVLVETFPRANRSYLVAYPFEGRLAHQTLGMLLTRRMERAGALPLGFVANDYGLSIWCGADLESLIDAGRLTMDGLFDEDMLG